MLELGKLVAEFAEGENNVPGTTATGNEVFSSFFSLNNQKPLAWLPLVRKWSGKKFFKVREKSGNCASSQGKFKSLKEVRKSGVLKLRNSFPSLLLFSNVKNSLFHFTDMNFVTLVEYFSEKLNNKMIVSF